MSENPAHRDTEAMDRALIVLWRFRFADAPDAQQLLPLIQDGEKERWERYKVAEARREFLVCRAALRILLGQRLGVPAREVPLAHTEKGKPFAHGGPECNLSHSGGWGVVAIHDQQGALEAAPLGVDIEERHRPVDCLAIAQRYYGKEFPDAAALSPEALKLALFRAWTRKEAWAKAHGLGLPEALATDLSDCCRSGPVNEPTAFRCPQGLFWLQDVAIGERLTGSVVCLRPFQLKACDFRW